MAKLWSVEVRNTELAVVVAGVIVYLLIFKFVRAAVLEPLRLRRIMTKQGVRGPPFKFLLGQYMDMVKFSESFPVKLDVGNLANLSPTVSPQYAMYFPKYGKMFLYWWGTDTKLVVRDAEIVKELLLIHHDSLVRPKVEKMLIKQLIGQGLLTQEIEKWTSERRIVNSSFSPHALKTMIKTMVHGAASEIQIWERKVVEAHGEVEINVAFGIYKISGDIISMMISGHGFTKGEQIFQYQKILTDEVMNMFQSAPYWLIPGYRYLPTKGNKLINLCTSKVNAQLHGMVHDRQELIQKGKMSNYGNDDILGHMLAVARDGWDESAQEFNMASVLSHFKTLYFAGQDPSGNTLMFGMLMLALHPEWQERARREVCEVLGEEHDEESWTASTLSRLKVVGMICNETLRLFPPGISITRVATKDLQLKGLFVPKGMTIECALAAIHQDKDYWGADVGEFNPGRFAYGVSEACSHRQAFFPFGLGPKTCLGNNVAIMIFKVVMAMVLQRFQLLPSPNYKHHPTCAVVQKPKFGLPIILKALRE